ncbi:MAG TPA: DUF480 domain-containing protein [Ilumatobacter sp.]|nr:DUF480 domain-containing protein [Ilumatobacter sp.]
MTADGSSAVVRDGPPSIHDLDPYEVRVLGCLVEKETTTPDVYPLTLNSLRSACNQSTSRDPVVAYTDPEIEQALTSLRGRGLTRTVHSTSNRATKFRHVLPDVLQLDAAETAVLAVLMLRGAQTAGELKGRTERQHRFHSSDEVGAVLTSLATRDDPLVRRLDRQPGQKDARWVHLLAPLAAAVPAAGAVADEETGIVATAPAAPGSNDPYGEATAEFYDLLETAMWDTFGLQMLDELAGVDPSDGPIIDVGSGTGVGLAYLRAAVPGARLVAIEPSKAMRVALHTRLSEFTELREQTTVIPTTFGEAPLPDRASAMVLSALIGHLSDAERTHLWSYVAEHTVAGAPVVIGVLAPARPLRVELLKYGERRIGDYVYEGWQSGVPLDELRMMWTMVYKVVDSVTGTTVAEYTATAPWRCDGADDIRREITSYGLTMTEHDDYVIVRRPE